LQSKIKTHYINFTILFFSVLVIFLFLEGISKIYIEHFANSRDFQWYASLEQKKEKEFQSYSSIHRYIGYIPTPGFVRGKNKHNSIGLRGEEVTIPKPQGEFRIICIGGSTTYTPDVEDYNLSYPNLLEEQLFNEGYENVKVINAGMLSYTTYESLINLQLRLLDLEPDLLIIYHAVNDVHARLVWSAEAYKGDNSGYRLSVYESNLEHGSSFWSYFNLGRIISAKLADKDRTHQMLLRKGGAITSQFFELRYQRAMGTYPEGIFKKTPIEKILKTNPPIYFRRNLNYMISIAKSNEVDVMLSTFAFCPDSSKNSTYSFPPLYNAIKEHNRVLSDIARERGVYLFDFASQFPNDKKYFQDDIHVTEEGSRLKSKLFSEFIIENKLMEKHQDTIIN